MQHKHHVHSPQTTGPHPSEVHAQHAAHDHSAMISDFFRRFWACLVLTVPVVAISPMFQHAVGYRFDFPGRDMVSFALATFIYVYGGKPFLTGLFTEVRRRSPGMMTLIGIAISIAYLYSTAVVFGLVGGMDFYWELATLIVIMLLGHWLEMKSVAGASKALEMIVKMLPDEAHMFHGEMLHDMRVEELKIGDLVLVKPGEKVPVDGIVQEGSSHLDESMLTGESLPAAKSAGSRVIAGAINGEGSLKIQVEKTGKESYLNKVIALVREAQESKSETQNLADRAARWLTFISLGTGAATLLVWLAKGQTPAFALERMVTVMVTACPHALGVAIPLVVAISTAMSARRGLLIRNRTAFENARKISAMVFDKTGTLTEGKFGVSEIEIFNEKYSIDVLLGLAAALEQHSEHPIAKGIVRAAAEKKLDLPAVTNFSSMTGKGVRGVILGKKIAIVSPGFLAENEIVLPENVDLVAAAATRVFILEDERPIGAIALADRIRSDARNAVEALKSQGIQVYMATGDNAQVAQSVAQSLGLDGFFAEVLPHEKVEIVKKLQASGQFVAMTGDGVNDAPALAQADVGIAVGSGTDVAAETADIILTDSRPSDVLELVNFGKATYRKMVQNLFWATGYNIIAIPLAAGVLYPAFTLSPALGAVLMSVSTVVVAANAQLLKRNLETRLSDFSTHLNASK
ncbi:MAG: heavy metal translocating P-type ATPase [Saprospiraceae bacterium]|nr:heavy metal translocating P-type ATPase [Saprospiraceae bacterium]